MTTISETQPPKDGHCSEKIEEKINDNKHKLNINKLFIKSVYLKKIKEFEELVKDSS